MDHNDCTLAMTRFYKAPRELVWEVWTDPNHVAAWWGPFGPEETRCEIDAVVGGVFYVAMTAPDGSQHPSRGVIKEIIPSERLVIEGDPNAPDACGAGLPPGAVITVLFEEDGKGTKLTLDAVFPSAKARENAQASGYETSWTTTLDDLQGYFDRYMRQMGEKA